MAAIATQAIPLEVTGRPLFRSTVNDMLSGWHACVATVSGGNLHPNPAELIRQGWSATPVTINGKEVAKVFAKRDVSAIIDVVDNGCQVAGWLRDQNEFDTLRQQLGDEFTKVAQERNGKANSWMSDGKPAFWASGLVSRISVTKTLAEVFSRDLQGMIPVEILVADGGRSKQ